MQLSAHEQSWSWASNPEGRAPAFLFEQCPFSICDTTLPKPDDNDASTDENAENGTLLEAQRGTRRNSKGVSRVSRARVSLEAPPNEEESPNGESPLGADDTSTDDETNDPGDTEKNDDGAAEDKPDKNRQRRNNAKNSRKPNNSRRRKRGKRRR